VEKAAARASGRLERLKCLLRDIKKLAVGIKTNGIEEVPEIFKEVD
jgi:hypothetical protein